VVASSRSNRSVTQQSKRLHLNADGSFRFAVLSDTHSALHPLTSTWLEKLKPDAILHAGDIGAPHVLDDLGKIKPVFAVRGNIDARIPGISDVLTIELLQEDQLILRILMLHIGVYGPKLNANVARLARTESASLIVCGHSHVPFIGSERGLTVFNPGSIGPRRFGLPIVFGMIDVSAAGLRLSHIDGETGLPWEPPRA
jgi:putative phosphoesterase